MKDFESLEELLEHFTDQSVCIKCLENERWPEGIICPKCGGARFGRSERYLNCLNPKCKVKFQATTDTVYARSRIGLQTWFAAIYLACENSEGITSMDLHRRLQINQRTAWLLLYKIRRMVKTANPDLLMADL